MIEKQIYFEEEQSLESKLRLENPENILSEYGLTGNQSKVYLHMNKFGAKSASNLSKMLNIPRTEIYAILKTLQKKGCITLKNEKPMKFDSIPFEEFLEALIRLKKNEILKLEETHAVVKKLESSNFQYC